MKKILMTMCVAAASLLPAKAQLLYRISGNGLQKESYIVGTFHLADGSFVDKIPGARQAIASVDQVCGELDFTTSTENVDSMTVLTNKMRMPEGKTIKDVLTAEQFNKLDTYAEKIIGMKLSNQMLYSQMGAITPQGLAQTLSLMKIMKQMQMEGKTIDVQNAIDGYIQKVAKEAGKKTLGLETISFQANVLFGDPMERQVENLMCQIDNEAFNDAQTANLIKLYDEQNVEGLFDLTMEKMGNSCDPTPDEMDRLIFNRNANWVVEMPAIMRSASTLFVVGAAHLGGDRGVLKGLQKAGYTVEGVK